MEASKTYVQLLTHNGKDIRRFNVYYCEGQLYRMDANNKPNPLKPGADGTYLIGYRGPKGKRGSIRLNLKQIVKYYDIYINPLMTKDEKRAERTFVTTPGAEPIVLSSSSSSDEPESTESETESDHPKPRLDVSLANSGEYLEENLYRRLHIRMLWEIKEAIKSLGMKPLNNQ